MNSSLIVIANDIRSAHNVGSLFRTCEGLGVDRLILTGYTPYPQTDQDKRLPHIARKLDQQIAKTSLGAEKFLKWEQSEDISAVLADLKSSGYQIAALEQHEASTTLDRFEKSPKLALLLGNEVTGVEEDLLEKVDTVLEIPMAGRKESFNVVEAATMAIYHLKHLS